MDSIILILCVGAALQADKIVDYLWQLWETK